MRRWFTAGATHPGTKVGCTRCLCTAHIVLSHAIPGALEMFGLHVATFQRLGSSLPFLSLALQWSGVPFTPRLHQSPHIHTPLLPQNYLPPLHGSSLGACFPFHTTHPSHHSPNLSKHATPTLQLTEPRTAWQSENASMQLKTLIKRLGKGGEGTSQGYKRGHGR